MRSFRSKLSAVAGALALTATFAPASADAPYGFLETLHQRTTLTSTITPNGDLNPYAVIVAPVSSGTIHKGDVLVEQFNNPSNFQGNGTTIVELRSDHEEGDDLRDATAPDPWLPGRRRALDRDDDAHLGLGHRRAGSSSEARTARTGRRARSAGYLIVLDSSGKLATTWTGPNISSPRGNMATLDRGATATLFVSMAGFDVPGPEVRNPATSSSVTVKKATVLRLDLTIPNGKPPTIANETIVANGLGERATDSFLIGPTGLALGADGTLYVSDALANAIVKISDAPTRTTSAGTGDVITKDGLLRRPLSLVMTPGGDLLACNALNGQIVEIDPAGVKQLSAQWINVDQAQTPPGNGDLFGMAIMLDGSGLYYIGANVNALVQDVPSGRSY